MSTDLRERIDIGDPKVRPTALLKMACREARKSPDPSTKNGAVLLLRRDHYCADCNRFSVLGDSHHVTAVESALLDNRDTKLAWIEHAERNAIFGAIREGLDVRGSTLYCPFAACVDCARAIVLCGVAELVRMPRSVIPWPESWAKSIEEADRILRAGGVKVTDYDGPALGETYLVNKQELRV